MKKKEFGQKVWLKNFNGDKGLSFAFFLTSFTTDSDHKLQKKAWSSQNLKSNWAGWCSYTDAFWLQVLCVLLAPLWIGLTLSSIQRIRCVWCSPGTVPHRFRDLGGNMAQLTHWILVAAIMGCIVASVNSGICDLTSLFLPTLEFPQNRNSWKFQFQHSIVDQSVLFNRSIRWSFRTVSGVAIYEFQLSRVVIYPVKFG